jgi:hypothetical protein
MIQKEKIIDYMKGKERVRPSEIASALSINLGNVRWILSHYKGDFRMIRRNLWTLRTETATTEAPKVEQVVPKTDKFEKYKKCGLVGVEEIMYKIDQLIKYGKKAIFIGGFHGLGKTTMVYELAKFHNAEVIRLQVTELLSEIDIIGGLDIKTGKIQYSEFVEKILEAIEHKEKQYFVLLDEFTRGREEALNILFPVLAEKKLFINSPYSKYKMIELPENIKVFGTGNIKDKGIREVGEAEFDRWNGVEVVPIQDTSSIKKIIKAKTELKDDLALSKLTNFYQKSWINGGDMLILPMSHRTLIETAQITSSKIKDGMESVEALKETIQETYFISSQAILNPNFKKTFGDMMREVFF